MSERGSAKENASLGHNKKHYFSSGKIANKNAGTSVARSMKMAGRLQDHECSRHYEATLKSRRTAGRNGIPRSSAK